MLLIVCRLIECIIPSCNPNNSRGVLSLDEDVSSLLGFRIRELRLEMGISQEELAERAGVHRTYLGGVERGERNPSLKNITAVARALSDTLQELFVFDRRRSTESRD